VKERKKGRGNLAQPCNLCYASAAALEIRGWEAIKDGLFLKKSWSADPLNTSSENLLSTTMSINVKLITAGFFQSIQSPSLQSQYPSSFSTIPISISDSC
jgi:hypothetical protein